MQRRTVLSFLCALVITGTAGFSIAGSQGKAPRPADQLLIETGSGPHAFTIELAKNDEDRARGLMFRKELAADRGMLFDFGQERPVAMWMRNTYIPLDMVFIRADGRIADIARDTIPLSERTIEAAAPVRYVLELPAGTARRIGAKLGDTVRHAAIPN